MYSSIVKIMIISFLTDTYVKTPFTEVKFLKIGKCGEVNLFHLNSRKLLQHACRVHNRASLLTLVRPSYL